MQAEQIYKMATAISATAAQNNAAIEVCSKDAACFLAFSLSNNEERETFISNFYEAGKLSSLRTAFSKKAGMIFNGISEEKPDSRGRVIRYVMPAFKKEKDAFVMQTDKTRLAKEDLIDSGLLRFMKETTLEEQLLAVVKRFISLGGDEQTFIRLYRSQLPAKKPIKNKKGK